ncbi:MAG: DUF5690 family protein [Cytophagales bacterium]
MKIKKTLSTNEYLFSIWCIIASFGTYFCMYAFRKPFNSASYEGYYFLGMGYKSVLIISQVLGYMISKFTGVKVISELKAKSRSRVITVLVVSSYLPLVLFAFVPTPYHLICLFLNGLPLGMVFGVVFSYLEGRRLTELIVSGLTISIIFSSSILKSIAQYLIQVVGVNEFSMPMVTASIFLPLFFGFVWMLEQIPAPNNEDIALKTIREPMSNREKIEMLAKYGMGIFLLCFSYILLTVCRDFRDNFGVEIWSELGYGNHSEIYALGEMPVGLITLLGLMYLSTIKNNIKGFNQSLYFILTGGLVLGCSTLMFKIGLITPLVWMITAGSGLFFAYTPLQSVVFDRLIALFKMKGNAGFLIYICDSTGYMFSVALLLGKEWINYSDSWSILFVNICLFTSFGVLASVFMAILFFSFKKKWQLLYENIHKKDIKNLIIHLSKQS